MVEADRRFVRVLSGPFCEHVRADNLQSSVDADTLPVEHVQTGCRHGVVVVGGALEVNGKCVALRIKAPTLSIALAAALIEA